MLDQAVPCLPCLQVSVMEFGAFVNIGAATDGLLHISQISAGFVKRVADVVKVGDEVSIYARVLGIGRSSIRVFIEAWRRARTGGLQRVTSATFVYVAIGPDGRPRPVDPAP